MLKKEQPVEQKKKCLETNKKRGLDPLTKERMKYKKNDLILINSPKMAISPTEIIDWTIYRITNPNGRDYVGLTRNLKNRLWYYRTARCKGQTCLYNSIVKYGWENHSLQVVDEFSSDLLFAEGKEMFWVRSYMSNRHKFPKQNGMNLNDGGGTNAGHKMSEEQKIKISQSNKGRKVGEEGRKRMAIAAKGRNLGVQKSEQTKARMSKSRLGKTHPELTKRKIGETRIRLAIPSPTKGIKLSDERRAKISLFMKGKAFMLGKKLSEETKIKIGEYHKSPIVVYLLNGDFVNEYPSLKAVTQSLNVPKSTIGFCLSGRTKNHKKYIFKYKGDIGFGRVKMKRREFKLIDIGQLLNKVA